MRGWLLINNLSREVDMTTEQMRDSVKAHYHHSQIWCVKVDKMSDAQIFAVYMRLTNADQSRRDDYSAARAS